MPLTTTWPRMVTLNIRRQKTDDSERMLRFICRLSSVLCSRLWLERRPLDDLAALHLGEEVRVEHLVVDAVELHPAPFDRGAEDAAVETVGRLERGAHLGGVERVGALDRLVEQQHRVIEVRHE